MIYRMHWKEATAFESSKTNSHSPSKTTHHDIAKKPYLRRRSHEGRRKGETVGGGNLSEYVLYNKRTSWILKSMQCNSQNVELDELGSLRPIRPSSTGGSMVGEYSAQAALPFACTEPSTRM